MRPTSSRTACGPTRCIATWASRAPAAGLCQAHVIRLLSPCTDEVRKRHLHETELQLIYVLQGWVKNEFEGEGVQMMSAGSCWLQPPGIKHTVLDYSADAELLEIIVPADFKTARRGLNRNNSREDFQ